MKEKMTFSKLRLKMLLLLLICLISISCSISVHAENEKPMLTPEDAEAFINVLLSDDPAFLDGMYKLTPDMEKAISASGGWKTLAMQFSSLGEADKIGPAYADTLSGREVLRVPCSFSVLPLDLVFVLEDGVIGGLITDKFTGEQEKTAEEPKKGNFTEIDLSVPVPELNGELPGTLTIPKGDGPFPGVILVHGSGPNNRDEEIMNVRPFRELAEGLAENGIAVYRYDKRTFVYGAELASDRQVTLMEETVKDAVTAVQIVSAQDKIDPSKIVVLGHSLGAMSIPAIDGLLREEPVKAAGYVFMAPPARHLDELMREQYEFLLSLQPEISEEQKEEQDKLFSELDRLKYLESLPDDEMIAGAFVPYWKWLYAYDPLKEADSIEVPCLILQGEEDYQVTMEDYHIWEDAVGKRSNWKLISYGGLVHAFVPGQKTEGLAVYQKDVHVDSQVISDIADFINSID